MADIKKLPLQDVRYLAQQLVHSYGGLAGLAKKHPWIKDYSQEVVREIYGDEFSVWRYLTVKDKQKIEPEKTVSLTANPSWIFHAIATAPGAYLSVSPISRGTSMVMVNHAILKYKLSPDRVIFYVPAIIDVALDMFRDSLNKWIARPHKEYPMSIAKVFRRIMEDREEEIVADVTGLKPEVIDFRDKEDNWWWDKHLVGDIAGGRMEPVEKYVEDLLRRNAIVPNKEWPKERILEHFKDTYRRLEDFFAA